jgi:hypothetical protein
MNSLFALGDGAKISMYIVSFSLTAGVTPFPGNAVAMHEGRNENNARISFFVRIQVSLDSLEEVLCQASN